jgi:hypothetical protein
LTGSARLRFAEDEPLLNDADATLVDLGRVVPIDPSASRIRVFIVLAYSRDYGCHLGVSAHAGDSERVVVDLRAEANGDVVITAAYAAAHEGTLFDHGQILQGNDVDQLEWVPEDRGEPRWVVYSSRGKHATYLSSSACDGAFAGCVESCGSGPTAPSRLPRVFNMGEPDAPRVDALDDLGLPGERAWSEQRFCGGLAGAHRCTSPLREKLTKTRSRPCDGGRWIADCVWQTCGSIAQEPAWTHSWAPIQRPRPTAPGIAGRWGTGKRPKRISSAPWNWTRRGSKDALNLWRAAIQERPGERRCLSPWYEAAEREVKGESR